MSLMSGNRRHEQNSSSYSTRFHLQSGRLGKKETSAQVNVHHFFKVCWFIFEKIAEECYPCIRDCYIKPAKLFNGVGNHLVNEGSVSGITSIRNTTAMITGNSLSGF